MPPTLLHALPTWVSPSPSLPFPQVRRVIDDMRQSGQSIDINVVVDRLARES